ncbi:MAG: hypothetical protein ACT4PU_10740 [Planctomycetota bacterium]
MTRHVASLTWLMVLALPAWAAAQSAPAVLESAAVAPFPNFESGPVNSLLLSPDGRHLYVLNTPDHRVEIFSTFAAPGPAGGHAGGGVGAGSGAGGPAPGLRGGAGVLPTSSGAMGPVPSGTPLVPPASSSMLPAVQLRHLASVFTGLEPVAMALHPDDASRLFVSNHVSDSVSVVDLKLRQVVATIPVGDEPQGLAFASGRLFVACARAEVSAPAPGQVVPGALQEHVVVVVGAAPPYARLGLLSVGAVKPRDVLAVGSTLYALPQNSGNHTTILDETSTTQLGLEQEVPDAFDAPFTVNPVLLRPELSALPFVRGWPIPTAARIVLDSEYPALVPQLADRDLVPFDAQSLQELPGLTTGIATTLLDVERNPLTGALWVAGTEARNRVRFEPVLKGDFIENRVVLVAPGGGVQQSLELAPPLTAKIHSQPAVLVYGAWPAVPPSAVSPGQSAGARMFVGCLGTGSLVAFDAATAAVVGEGLVGGLPGGLAVDGPRARLFVHDRLAKTLRAYDARNLQPLGPASPAGYDPEPAVVSAGRRHLYAAQAESGHGTGNASCASCHVFGHFDQLAWDLGDPGGSLSYYYPDVLGGLAGFPGEIVSAPSTAVLNPLKGPMTTQSLRGLMDPDTQDALPLHWRGDRRTMHMFRGAFQGLLGGSGISRTEMQEFSSFVRSLRYAGNPLQPKDRQYTGLQAQGRDLYGMNPDVPGKDYVQSSGFLCISCHKGDFTNETDFTGSRITASKGSFTQIFNTAQLRAMYEKDFKFTSGFGALHDGVVDGVRGFMDFMVPNGGLPTFSNFTTPDKDAVASFVRAWDSGFSPLVGQQWTMRADTLGESSDVLSLFEAQARPPASNVDLILKGYRIDIFGELLPRGAHYRFDTASGTWGYLFDTGTFASRELLQSVVGTGFATFTFTCVPPGLGERLGLDRDEDGLHDFAESLAGTNAARADSDGDAYADGTEAALGGDPASFDARLGNPSPPAVLGARVLEIFVDSGTLNCRTDEPASLLVELGTQPGVYSLPAVSSPLSSLGLPALRRSHDLLLSALPAGTDIHYRVTARDRDGLTSSVTGSFKTLPRFFHVADLTLQKSGAGPFTLTARVLVHDHLDQPVPEVPVRAFWAGDLGGQPWEQQAFADAQGWATFTLQPYTPAASTQVSFSPIYIGTPFPNQPFFVGLGGGTSSFFYDQPSNKAHYASISVP